MLKRLRRKIVGIVMLLTGIVMVASNLVGFFSLTSSLGGVVRKGLAFAVEAGPSTFGTPWIGSTIADDTNRKINQELGPEISNISFTIYVAVVGDDGVVVASNEDAVSIQGDVLADALSTALASDDDYGRIPGGNLMYARQDHGSTSTVALLDITSLITVVRDNFLNMVQRIVVVLVLLFAAAVLLARYATAPVARALQQQQRFVSDASHELKTPITVILASADILQKHPDAPAEENAQWVSSIVEEATRLKTLVNDLVAAARAAEESDRGRQASASGHERISISELTERSALQFEAVAFDRGVDFTWNVEPDLMARGNAAELERLAKILLDNAMKYAQAPAGGGAPQVRLDMARVRDRIVLTVANSGEPIPQDKLEHLFDRFYRADESRTQGGSFGLGLFIAQSIAQAHGGSISVTSTQEDGTVFKAHIPAESSLARLKGRAQQ